MRPRERFACAAIAALALGVGCSGTFNGGATTLASPPGEAGPATSARADGKPFQGGVASVSVGAFHVCAVDDAGSVYCWGRNDTHQIGDGSDEPRSRPTLVGGFGPASAVVAGYRGTCAVTRRGELFCWGTIGRKVLDRPTRIEGLTDVRSVAIANTHTCALVGSGSVRCWGENSYGQLGTGSTDALAAGEISTVRGVSDARDVIVDGSSSCALRKGGDVVCWGAGRFVKAAARMAPGPITGLPKLKSLVSYVGLETCGVSLEGEAFCWGTHPRMPDTAFKLDGWSNVSQFVMASLRRCAVASDTGALVCSTFDRKQMAYMPPHEAPGFGGISRKAVIAAGGETLCVLDGGKLACQGGNEYGQLGIGEMAARSAPYEIAGLEGVEQVMPFANATCALEKNGKVACWGIAHSASEGRAAGKKPRKDGFLPHEIEGLSGVTHLMQGSREGEACASKANGELWCFKAGLDAYEDAGDEQARAFVPHRVLGLKNVVSTVRIVDPVAPGFDEGAYGVLSNGSVVAFRAKAKSEREEGGALVVDAVEKPIAGLSDVTRIVVSSPVACALERSGTVDCFAIHPPFGTWKSSGVDLEATKPDLIRVAGIESAVDIGAGKWFFARSRDGAVFRWTVAHAGTPPLPLTSAMPLPALSGATSLSHVAPLCIALPGKLACERDRLGREAPPGAAPLPFPIDADGVASLESGPNTCVVRDTGRVACWGSNLDGALGAPDRDHSDEPVRVELRAP